MAEEIQAERLYVEIVADASGFRRDLKAKVDAAAENVRAKIRAEVEFRATQVRASLNEALAEGTKAKPVRARVEFSGRQAREALNKALREGGTGGSTVRARVEFNAAQVRAALNRAIREGVRQNAVTARVEFDAAQVRAALERATRQAEVGSRAAARVNVEADTGRFTAETEAARRIQEVRPVRLRVDSGGIVGAAQAIRAAGRALITLNIAPTIASGLLLAAGALTNVAGGLFAVTSAASQAVGVLSILPGLATAAAQAVAVLALGFSGIGGALKALEAADKSAATTSGRSARSQIDHAGQIRAARERLAEAQRSAAERIADAEESARERVADAQERAAERIADADRSVADSHRRVQRAQEDLTQARERAREEIQQLAFSLRESVLSEEQAQINLERAQAKVLAARQSTVISPLDRRQAELDLKKAILDLEEAKDRASDLAKENKKASKAGVEGSETVRQAKEALADANRALRDAEREAAEARRDSAKELARARRDSAKELARARRDSAKEVKSAQDALNQTLKASQQQADATSAAVNNLGYALDKLSPAGRRFAQFLHSTVIPRLREMRNAVQGVLLPKMEQAMRAAAPLLDVLQAGFKKTAGTVGDLAIKFGRLAGSKAFRKDTATIMKSNDKAIESFGNAAFYLFDALRHVMVVAGPLVERFARVVEKWAEGRKEAAKTGRETGAMAERFEKAWDRAAQLAEILDDLWDALRNVGRAATPSGETMLDSLADGADRLRKWTEDPENQERLKRFFEETIPVMEQFADLLGRIFVLIGNLGEATGGGALDGLFFVLDKFVAALEAIADMPAGGTILTTIFLLAGVGLGLGFVARALGGIVANLSRLARFTGVSRLFSMLLGGGRAGRRGRSQVGEMADDVGRLTEEIDRELPKDRQKRDALGEVGGQARRTREPMTGLADDMERTGRNAERAGKRTSKFGRVLGGLKGVAGKAGRGLAGLGGLLLSIPGVGGLASKLSGALKKAFAKIKLPKIKLPKLKVPGAAGAGAKGGGLFAGLLSGLLGKLPGVKGFLGRVKGWFTGLLGGIKRIAGKFFTKKSLTTALSSGVKGGARGALGGPIGLIAGVLGSIVGGLIGGGKGGKRGAAGGAISGGATGAGVGALVGSIVPGLGTAVGAVVGGVIGAIVGAIGGGKYWKRLGTAIKNFFTRTLPNMFKVGVKLLPGAVAGIAVFGWILDQAKKVGPKIKKFFLDIAPKIAKALVHPGDAFDWLRKQARKLRKDLGNLLDRAMKAVTDAIGRGLGNAGRRAQDKLKELTQKFKEARDRWKARIREAMDSIVKNLKDRLSVARTKTDEILDKIGRAFKNAKDYIGRQWDKLKDATKKPLNFVIGLYMGGIKPLVEGLAGAVGAKITLPTIKKFARGGVVADQYGALPGYAPGRDTMIAAVSPGEAWMRPEFTRGVGPEWVDLANRIARTRGAQGIRRWLSGRNELGGEGMAFARGGIVPGLPRFAGHFALGGIIGDLVKGVKDFTIGNVERAAKSVLGKIISGVVPGTGAVRDAIARIPAWIKDTVFKWIKDKVSFGGGPSFERGLAWAKTQHGKPYQWGGNNNPSWDCSGFISAIEAVIRGQKPHRRWSTHPFHGGAGNPMPGWYRNKRSAFMIGVTPADVGHVAGTLLGTNVESSGSKGVRVGASARGFTDSMFPYRYGFSRDQGGPLPPGTSLVDNGTRRNEWVLSPEAIDLLGGERAVAALNAGASRLYRASRAVPATAAPGSGSPARPAIESTINVYPQQGQSELEIAVITARKLGAMIS